MSDTGPLAGLVAELRAHLAFRRMSCGMRLLAGHDHEIASLDPLATKGGILLGLVAQWVDAGHQGPELVRALIDRFRPVRAEIPLLDYLHVRLAEGMVAMAADDFSEAMRHYRFVLTLENEIPDTQMLAIANFWAGRCLRRMARYEDSLVYTSRGRQLAVESGYAPMAAVMQVQESWLAFQRGRADDAVRLLREAEGALSGTDDQVTRGNIHSAYGRIARRQGRYEAALEHFNCAMAQFQGRDPLHLHLARTLVNIAVAERLLALEGQKEIDEDVRRRRAGAAGAAGTSRAPLQTIGRLREAARMQLSSALEIYTSRQSHRGIATVQVTSAQLKLDSGDLEGAQTEAATAFELAERRDDQLLMARSRLLQCAIAQTRIDEQIDEPSAITVERAAEYAAQAIEYARQSQNPRLLARAYVQQGLMLVTEPDTDVDAARHCCYQAMELLQPEGGATPPGWDDLERLKARVLHSRPIDPLLRAWSNGSVDNKTFQQMTEDFARIVIPKVWEREDRKIARVAKRLSMSPKKVRRILSSAGVSEAKHAPRANAAGS